MKRVFIILLFLSLLPGLNAVEMRPVPIRTDDGLTGATINCLARTRDGYLWIGTPEGLLRYDGYSCRLYPLPPGETDVTEITEDAFRRLWVSASGRWVILDNTTDAFITDIDPVLKDIGISNPPVFIERDGNFGLWIATSDAVYHLVPGSTIAKEVEFGTHPSLKGRRITGIAEGPRYITAVTDHGELYEISPQSHRVVRFDSHIPAHSPATNKGAYHLHYDREGLLWIYNVGNLWLFDSNRRVWMEDTLPPEARRSAVRTILQDAWGRTWMGRDHNGLEQVKRFGSGFIFIPRSSLAPTLRPGVSVSAMCDDHNGNIWIGTERNGLFLQDEISPRFILYPLPPVHLILSDPGNSVWLATDCEGIMKWDPDTESTTTFSDGKFTPCPLSIATCDGRLFAALPSGGLREAIGGRLPVISTGLPADTALITALASLPSPARLIMATSGGELYTFAPTTGHTSHIPLSRVLPSGRVNSITCASDSSVAIAKGSNALLLSPSLQKLTIIKGPWQSELNYVMKDSRGLLWITSDEGIDLYRPGTCKLRRLKTTGVPGLDSPGSLVETSDGAVWTATRKDLMRMTITTDSITGHPVVTTVVYDRSTGLPGGFIDPRALATLPPGGEILAGSSEGVSRFLPGRSRNPSRHPGIIFSSITAGGRKILPDRADGSPSISLNPSVRDLVLTLTIDNPAVTSRTGYRYMLEGYDRDWKTLDPGKHTIKYSSLPSGHYRLLVKVFAGHIPTDGDPVVLDITVREPFYLSLPAVIVYIFILFFAAVGLRRKLQRGKTVPPAVTREIMTFTPPLASVSTLPANARVSNAGDSPEPDERSNPEKTTSSATDSMPEEPSRAPVFLIHHERETIKRLTDILSPVFEVFSATDGEAAVVLLNSTLPSLILTGAPDVTPGFHILSTTIKSHPSGARLPILILGDDDSLSTRTDMILYNADAIVSPTLPDAVLISCIRKLISLSRKIPGSILFPPLPADSIAGEKSSDSTDLLFLQQTVKNIVGNLARPDYSVEELSASLGISRVHLYKKLKALTGKTPLEIIRRIRLRHAAIILLGGDVTMAEVASRVGFNSTKYFVRYFKEEYTILPSEYRDLPF